MASAQQIAALRAGAAARGLDPDALLAVSQMEGLSGGIGDGGHAFGPFQENNAGGVLTGRLTNLNPQQLNAWAWSPAGMKDALDRIARVASGLKGRAAVDAIVNQFERPENPGAERAGAYARLGQYPGLVSANLAGSSNGRTAASDAVNVGSTPTPAAGPNPNQRAALTALKLSGGDPTVIKLLTQSLSNPSLRGTPALVTSSKGNAALGQQLVATAKSQLGTPYQWGGPAALGKETDCSGLIQATLADHGISVGRTTYEQWKQGTPVDPKHLQPGDGLYFHMGPRGPEHVGMYIGNGQFIEDPHTGSVVRISNLSSYPGFVGARRFT